MRPVTQDDRDEILRRHAAGHTRNQIATAMERSGATISGIVAQAGQSFARGPEVAAATEARRQDLAARRLLLAEQLQADAENLREQLWQPAIVFAFGGKDNTYEEQLLDQPPAADKRAIMSTVGMAIDRSLKLEPIRDDAGADTARTMVGQLMAGLAEVYREQQAEAGGGEGAGDAP